MKRQAHGRATDYTPLRALPLPTRPKTAAEILFESAVRAKAAGDLVAAFHQRNHARRALAEARRQ
jgi:hypothetical protein